MMTSASKAAPRIQGLSLLDRIDYRLVHAPEYRENVYRLRYRAYLEAGLIEPMEQAAISDRFDGAPNTWIFGIHVDDELCASIRIQVLHRDWRMSNTVDIYGDLVHPRLDRGEVFIDASRLVADPEKAKTHPELALLALRLSYLACAHFDADTGLVMVRADHQAFYRRFFLCQPVCSETRPFPGWPSRRAALLDTDFRSVRHKVAARFPMMVSSAFERRMLFGPPVRSVAAATTVVEAAE